MRFGKTIHWAILATSLLAVACSSGSSDPGVAGGANSSVVQDLGADPSRQTTVITLPSAPSGPLTPGMFEADGTQLADSVSVVGSQATVTWDERVSPSDQVRAVGVPGVASDFVSVATSDSSSPMKKRSRLNKSQEEMLLFFKPISNVLNRNTTWKNLKMQP